MLIKEIRYESGGTVKIKDDFIQMDEREKKEIMDHVTNMIVRYYKSDLFMQKRKEE